jgi:transcriptional regulator PpsR
LNAQESLGSLDARTVGALLGAAGDIALVVDADGVVHDAAIHSDELAEHLPSRAIWLGRPWVDCVTVESRPKILTLLRAALDKAPLRQIHVNHLSPGGGDLPVQYAAVLIDGTGRLVAIGHDLRQQAQLQQRLVDAQQSMERDYLRLRHIETRYRLLFEMSSEAVLVLDAATLKTVEANPIARGLLGAGGKPLPGAAFPEFFDHEGGQAVLALLAIARGAGRADDARARLIVDNREVLVSASLFRQDNASLFLVRLLPAQPGLEAGGVSASRFRLLLGVESAPDGIVVTDTEGRVVRANTAFLDLVQLASQEQVRGVSLEQWFGRSGVDLGVLRAKLAQWGSVRLFATTLRGAYGATADVEISAVSISADGDGFYCFAIRDVGRRLAPDSRVGRELPRSVEQLTELIGRTSLKDLVREATDMIERLCIEAALEMTNDNRASAAELLGLSRQSLYLKLRRHGLGDLDPEPMEKD